MPVSGGSQYRTNGRTHYETNKQKYIDAAQARRERNRAHVRAIKEAGSCVDCGIADWRVLDFDHLPGFEKVAEVCNLARDGSSIARIDAEIAKCELRCANCHRIITAERRDSGY